MSKTKWERVGDPAPGALVETRIELHQAAQLAAAVGASLLEARPDDSHPNLGWSDASRGWVGRTVGAERSFAAALRPADLTLALEDEAGAPLAELDLAGRTLEEGLAWLGDQTRRLGAEAEIRLPGYELPPHAVASGGRFAPGRERERSELARWFSGAQRILAERATEEAGASPVRCWPHHFDLATLIILERDAGGTSTRTVGVGLSPGDDRYPEPYWYVSPWPHPAGDALPELGGPAHWHTDGFTAAILLGRDVVAAGSADAQGTRIQEFLAAAIAASREALAG